MRASQHTQLPATADETDMFQLVYTSTARSPLSDTELKDILRVARANNAREGITSVLLHHRGAFLQVLEGEEDVVEAKFARIGRDQRHRDLVVRSRCLVARREFEGCFIKFLDTGDWDIKPGLIGYNSLDQFAQADDTLKRYLRQFHVIISRQGSPTESTGTFERPLLRQVPPAPGSTRPLSKDIEL
jgi:hypothetical protein